MTFRDPAMNLDEDSPAERIQTLQCTDLIAGIRRIEEQSGGAFRIAVIRPNDAEEMFEAAVAGDDEMLLKLRLVDAAVEKVARAPKDQPMLCASCQSPVRAGPDFSVVLMQPRCDAPDNTITLTICSGCATDVAGIKRKACEFLRILWPGLREIQVSTQTGHA